MLRKVASNSSMESNRFKKEIAKELIEKLTVHCNNRDPYNLREEPDETISNAL